MGLREVGGGDWIDANTLDKGQVILEKGQFIGFAENNMGTYCQFRDDGGATVNVGGKTLVNACERIEINDFCKVVYEGKVKFKSGYKGHLWKLWVYEDEEGGSTNDVSENDKSIKSKASTKKTRTNKKAKGVEEKVVEDELDDMDELDNLD